MSSFEHRGLLGTEHNLRLLKLHSALSRADTLEFDLIHAHSSHCPHFAAISYTWDGQPFNLEAICEGKKYMITENCDKILRHLRPGFGCGSVLLWIDQICIDQGSAADKTLNVTRMSDIFTQARTVLIWTGDYDNNMAEDAIGVAYEEEILEIFPPTIMEHWSLKYGLKRHGGIVTTPKTNLFYSKVKKRKRPDSAVLRHFCDALAKKGWFNRMWTMQEALMPDVNRVSFIVGRYLLPLTFLDNPELMDGYHFYHMKPDLLHGGKHFALSTLLHNVRNRQCQDPRDRIFALHAIVKNSVQYSQACLFPQPDYTVDVKQVFTDAVVWGLRTLKDVKIIYLAVLARSELLTRRPSVALPSWVPDLVRLSTLNRQHRQTFFSATKIQVEKGHEPSIYTKLWGGQEPLILRLRGKIMDSIEFVSEEIESIDFFKGSDTNPQFAWDNLLRQILKAWLRGTFTIGCVEAKGWLHVVRQFWCSATYSRDISNLQPWHEACLRFLFAECLSEDVEKMSRFRHLVVDSENHQSEILSLAEKEHWPPKMTHGFRLLKETKNRALVWGGLSDEFRGIFRELERHVLVVTNGGLVGVVLGDVQKGDKVALFKMLDRTLILRPGEAWNNLVGHGFFAELSEIHGGIETLEDIDLG